MFNPERCSDDRDHTWFIIQIVEKVLGVNSFTDEELEKIQGVLQKAYDAIKSRHHYVSDRDTFLEDLRLLVIPTSNGFSSVSVIRSGVFTVEQLSTPGKGIYKYHVENSVSEESFLRGFLPGLLLSLKDVFQEEIYQTVALKRDSVAEIIQIQKYWPESRNFANHLLGMSTYDPYKDQAPLSAAVDNYAKKLMRVAHDKLDGMEEALHLFLSRFMLNALLGMTSVVSCRVSQLGDGKGMMIDQYGKVLFVDYEGEDVVPREYSLYEPVNYSAQMPLRILEALSIFFRDHLTKPYSDALLQAQGA